MQSYSALIIRVRDREPRFGLFQLPKKDRLEFLHLIGILVSEVGRFGKVIFEVVEFVDPLPELDQLPVAFSKNRIGPRIVPIMWKMPEQLVALDRNLTSALDMLEEA